MKNAKKYILYLFSIVALSGALAGCNTTKGFGQDVEMSGRAIRDAAR